MEGREGAAHKDGVVEGLWQVIGALKLLLLLLTAIIALIILGGGRTHPSAQLHHLCKKWAMLWAFLPFTVI